MKKKDFDEQNKKVILAVLNDFEKHNDELNGSVMATISQFILNMRVTIGNIAIDRDYVTSEEVVEAQIKELRRCIVDLQMVKQRMYKGVTKQ